MANQATALDRIDWRTVRATIDLADVVARLLGPAPGRRGERTGRLWWSCPLGTHADRNPSFSVRLGDRKWKCFGCGATGDAVALIRHLNPAMTFPEAVAYLAGDPAPTRPPKPRPRPASSGAAKDLSGRSFSEKAFLDRPRPPGSATANQPRGTTPTRPPADTPAGPSGRPEADTLVLVADAERGLWAPEGANALAYLHGRGLDDETIRAARLGWTPGVMVPTREGDRGYRVLGVVIPWFASGRLVLAKVRQPEGRKPKYAEVFRDPARVTGIYPGSEVIRPGRPLVIVEGEFEGMLLGQELARSEVAGLTLGSASARPGPALLGRLLAAAPWFVATDADAAGDRAASGWPARARRVRPPGPFKDWTEARQGGVDLRRWWGDILAGCAAPPLFTWDELAALRWGPARDDPTPGIVLDRPGPGRRMAALQAAVGDPEERAAIPSEDVCGRANRLCDNEGDGEGGCLHTLPLIRPLS